MSRGYIIAPADLSRGVPQLSVLEPICSLIVVDKLIWKLRNPRCLSIYGVPSPRSIPEENAEALKSQSEDSFYKARQIKWDSRSDRDFLGHGSTYNIKKMVTLPDGD